MANELQSVKHIHDHESLPEQAVTSAKNPAYAEGADWVHSHCHAHYYQQGSSQTYSFEHSHPHRHAAGTPKHSLADMKPEERAEIKRVCGRASLFSGLEDAGLRVGAALSNVQRSDTGGFSVEISGKTVELSAAEAEAVLVEVQ